MPVEKFEIKHGTSYLRANAPDDSDEILFEIDTLGMDGDAGIWLTFEDCRALIDKLQQWMGK